MKKLLIIGYVWPEPKSSAAGVRMMQLITIFIKHNYKVTFASPAQFTPYMADLKTIGVDVTQIELNNESFDSYCEQLNPDIVLFDRFMMEEQFGWRVEKVCPNAITILDTEDLHSLRKVRQDCYKQNKQYQTEDLLQADITKREIAAIYRVDFAIMISEYEVKLLIEGFKVNEKQLFTFPFLYEKLVGENHFPSYFNRNHFITIGNFLHEPNWNAVLFLKQKVWPLIRKQLKNAELHIYGAYASDKVKQLHQPKDGFLIKGRAEDVNEVMQQAKVCLAPIQFGAGIKGKLIDAMRNGTPSVTTSIGAEDMNKDGAWNGFIEDEPEAFAQKAVELYLNEHLWKEKSIIGFDKFNTNYANPLYEIKLMNKIDSLQKNLSTYRMDNFIGQLLKHQTLNATKYMSKWIEEKNK